MIITRPGQRASLMECVDKFLSQLQSQGLIHDYIPCEPSNAPGSYETFYFTAELADVLDTKYRDWHIRFRFSDHDGHPRSADVYLWNDCLEGRRALKAAIKAAILKKRAELEGTV